MGRAACWLTLRVLFHAGKRLEHLAMSEQDLLNWLALVLRQLINGLTQKRRLPTLAKFEKLAFGRPRLRAERSASGARYPCSWPSREFARNRLKSLVFSGPFFPEIGRNERFSLLICRVEEGRGGVEAHGQWLRFPSPLISRVVDWRAGLGRSLYSLLARSFVCECHTVSAVPRFQPPPRRTQHADFPHCAHLSASPQGLWDLSCRSRFRRGSYNAIALEEAHFVVHPLPTPPLPIEALTIPSALHMAPDLLFHPVFHEVEALAGMSDRKVVHPTAQHRVDRPHDPINQLRLVATKHILELPQQRRPLLELWRAMSTPYAPQTAHPTEIESQKAEAFASTEIHDPTLLLVDLDL